MIDFSRLETPATPNHWLLAPVGRTGEAKPHAIAPTFNQDPDGLFAVWQKVIAATPRTSEIKADAARRQLRYTATLPIVGFRDDVDIAVFPSNGHGSTVAVYSRSRVGYGDLGVNRRRVTTLLRALEAKL